MTCLIYSTDISGRAHQVSDGALGLGSEMAPRRILPSRVFPSMGVEVVGAFSSLRCKGLTGCSTRQRGLGCGVDAEFGPGVPAGL